MSGWRLAGGPDKVDDFRASFGSSFLVCFCIGRFLQPQLLPPSPSSTFFPTLVSLFPNLISSFSFSVKFALICRNQIGDAMCPLRIILIFLSATLAGFFVLRNLKSSQPSFGEIAQDDNPVEASPYSEDDKDSTRSSKVTAAIGAGFWTFVDMASGRYLWRHLVSESKSKRCD